ncbi:hypothetical protein DFJ74DRAFT_771567 [Hyaloraphidium curvatum]|nr:hypothetical protein DFJ74DRAFT_771567 [Hyaloraphidium curvatum]
MSASARRAVSDLHALLARGADRNDPALLQSCFWPGAAADLPPHRGRAEMLPAALDATHLRCTRHTLSNLTAAFDGQRCAGEVYVRLDAAWGVGDTPDLELHTVLGRWLTRAEKRGSEWRFSSAKFLYDWSTAERVPDALVLIAPAAPTSVIPNRAGIVGVRDPLSSSEAERRDPSYEVLPNALAASSAAEGGDGWALDAARIEEAMVRYARAVDRNDLEAVRAGTFWPEAEIAIGGFVGDLPGYLEWLGRFNRSAVARFHNITNALVRPAGPDAAVSECYMDAHNVRKSKAGVDEDRWGYGRYVDKWERRNGVWKIISRKLINDFARTVPHHPPAHLEPTMARGSSLDDRSFALLPASPLALSPELLAARDEIAAKLVRYCRLVDRFDERALGWEGNGAGDLFWPDAYLDFGNPQGLPESFFPSLIRGISTAPRNQHRLSNPLVAFSSPSSAASESYVVARRLVGKPGGKTLADRTLAGRYLDRWEKRNGVWKIAGRTLVIDFVRIEKGLREGDAADWLGTGKAMEAEHGRRGTGMDASFAWLGESDGKLKL